MEQARESAAPGEAILSVAGLRREFGGVWACTDATFDLRRGAITSLIGPNGAGKSTVVGIVGGAIAPSAGRIVFDGTDITAMPPTSALGPAWCALTNSPASSAGSRCSRTCSWPRRDSTASGYGRCSRKRYWRQQEEELLGRARILLDRFAMKPKEDEYAGNLSGGQKRLLEIMRALMSQPKLVLLDEPMAGVNPTLARAIEDYLADWPPRGSPCSWWSTSSG